MATVTTTITKTTCDFCKKEIHETTLSYYRIMPVDGYDPDFPSQNDGKHHLPLDLHEECATNILIALKFVGISYAVEPARKVTIDNIRGGKMTVDDPSQHFRYIYIDAVNVNVVHAFSANEAE